MDWEGGSGSSDEGVFIEDLAEDLIQFEILKSFHKNGSDLVLPTATSDDGREAVVKNVQKRLVGCHREFRSVIDAMNINLTYTDAYSPLDRDKAYLTAFTIICLWRTLVEAAHEVHATLTLLEVVGKRVQELGLRCHEDYHRTGRFMDRRGIFYGDHSKKYTNAMKDGSSPLLMGVKVEQENRRNGDIHRTVYIHHVPDCCAGGFYYACVDGQVCTLSVKAEITTTRKTDPETGEEKIETEVQDWMKVRGLPYEKDGVWRGPPRILIPEKGCSAEQVRRHVTALLMLLDSIPDMEEKHFRGHNAAIDLIFGWRTYPAPFRDVDSLPPTVRLNESQEDAMASLNATVSVIKAPPGTGKTYLVYPQCLLTTCAAVSGGVLVTSAMNAAVAAGLKTTVKQVPERDRVRRVLAYGRDDRVEQFTRKFLLPEKERQAAQHIKGYIDAIRNAAAETHGAKRRLATGIALDDTAASLKLAGWVEKVYRYVGRAEYYRAVASNERKWHRPESEDCMTRLKKANEDAKRERKEQREEAKTNVNEGATCHVDGFKRAVEKATECLIDGWKIAHLSRCDLLFGTIDSIPRLFKFRERVDTIIVDEAGTIPPQTIGMLWRLSPSKILLTGDLKQIAPYSNLRRCDPGAAAESLMSIALKSREEALRLKGKRPEKAARQLNIQYRCPERSSRLWSGLFYGGDVETAITTARDRQRAAEARGDCDGKEELAWVDVPRMRGRTLQEEEKVGTSYQRRLEATLALQKAIALLRKNRTATIAIITPYGAQLRLLKQLRDALPKADLTLASAVRDNGDDALSLYTFTRAQGREFDHTILTLVRANKERKIGDVKLNGCMCVALSRHRHTMTIFGDASTFEGCKEDNKWARVVRRTTSWVIGRNGMPKLAAKEASTPQTTTAASLPSQRKGVHAAAAAATATGGAGAAGSGSADAGGGKSGGRGPGRRRRGAKRAEEGTNTRGRGRTGDGGEGVEPAREVGGNGRGNGEGAGGDRGGGGGRGRPRGLRGRGGGRRGDRGQGRSGEC